MVDYKPEGKLLWDLWFIKEKNEYHSFYLQAKRSKDPEKRHDSYVTIGHAVSKNLKKWKELPTALKPGKEGEWDNLALWTGSVIKKGKKYYMFYTGRNKNKNTKWIQKIGLAISDDLTHWKKIDKNPILKADKKYYVMSNKINKLKNIGAWRDPYVFKDHKSGKYYITISARTKGNKREHNGCIALAESKDLLNWKILPPILAPGRYDEMETSQIIYHNNKYYLFFGLSGKHMYEPTWEKKHGIHTGLHCYYSSRLRGKYKPVNTNGIVIENVEKIYDTRLIPKKGNDYFAVGWLNKNEEGVFIGTMSKPFIITIKEDKVLKK